MAISIHRDVLKPDGVSFSASRAKDGVEFLASTDAWFRPCNLANAPDGNLYVTDIYRLFIETPESIPEELKKNMDFWAGDTMGRIYRIVPNKPMRQRDLKPQLGAATTSRTRPVVGEHQRLASSDSPALAPGAAGCFGSSPAREACAR